MKNLAFYNRLLLCFWMSLGLWGCESVLDLEMPAETLMERQTVFSDGEGAEAAARGMYAQMVDGQHTFYTVNNGGLIVLAGMSADILTQPSQGRSELLQFEQNTLMADNSMIEKVWRSLYQSVYSANMLLENLDAPVLEEGLVRRLRGEALFVRAFCYFYLISFFGDIPLVLTSDFQENANIPRLSVTEVYGQIETDLVKTRELLDWEHKGERTRPNKGAASALLARVYLYTENWQKAENMATEVLQQQEYELVAPEEIVQANNREALWQYHISSTSADAATPEGNTFQNLFTSHLYNAIREEFTDAFEAGDLREGEWVNQHFSGAYLPTKYKRSFFGGFDLPLEYTTILRLAEIYLIRAEARAQQDNVTGANSAESDLNVIRSRAGLGGTPAATREDMLDAIMQERKVELFTEWGHRWLDLKRTGRALEVLTPIKPGFTEEDLLWPIPQKEINNNPALRGHQNPGY